MKLKAKLHITRLELNAKYVGYKTKMRIVIARFKNKFGEKTKWK
jgi:hypothetical protein